jgi:hypothetical protein
MKKLLDTIFVMLNYNLILLIFKNIRIVGRKEKGR